ncbi:MAG: hypothetical protein ABW189_05430 [Rickettsiales bacterium]
MARKRIVLFGGSFDPPHEGHLYVSRLAHQTLRADEVRWIPALGNPLKPSGCAHGFDERMALCRALTQDNAFVSISDIERRMRLRFAVDVIEATTAQENRARFVWMMGSDCAPRFHEWLHWEKIVASIPLAIFSRTPDWREKIRTAHAFARYGERMRDANPEKLFLRRPPAIQLIETLNHPASSSDRRNASCL